MNRYLLPVLELLLVVSAVTLALGLLRPRTVATVAAAGAPSGPGVVRAELLAEPPVAADVPPSAVARLLGWKPLPPTVEQSPAQAPPPATITWLQQVGSGEDSGEAFYIFKDQRTGALVRLPATAPSSWELLQVSPRRFLVSYAGVTYQVDRE